MRVPSRMDNLLKTATEAQSCDVPFVAFNTTGLPDAVGHQCIGYLSTAFDPGDLAAGIAWVLDDSDRRADLANQAHCHTHQIWNPRRVATLYADLYQGVLKQPASAAR